MEIRFAKLGFAENDCRLGTADWRLQPSTFIPHPSKALREIGYVLRVPEIG